MITIFNLIKNSNWPKPLYAIYIHHDEIIDGEMFEVEEYVGGKYFALSETASQHYKEHVEPNYKVFEHKIEQICFCYLYRKKLKKIKFTKKYLKILSASIYRYAQHIIIK